MEIIYVREDLLTHVAALGDVSLPPGGVYPPH